MRALETQVAQIVSTSLDGLVPVRVMEQLEPIPKDQLVSVVLETKRQKDTAIINVFENVFKIRLTMHWAENTEQKMNEAGSSIHRGLMNLNAWNENPDVLHFYLSEVKRSIEQDSWLQEYSYNIVAVDKES